MKDFFKRNISFFKFCVVGGCSTLIDFAIYYALSVQIHLLLAKTTSMSCSMVFSYFFNKIWSFSSKTGNVRNEVPKYILTQIINLLINVSINYLVFKITKNKILAFVVATGLAMIVNYLIQRVYVFKKR